MTCIVLWAEVLWRLDLQGLGRQSLAELSVH
jgi:hypothetical protein